MKLILSKHAQLRMIQRCPQAAALTPAEIRDLPKVRLVKDTGHATKNGFAAEYHYLPAIDLVFVVNPKNGVAVTCWRMTTYAGTEFREAA
jgi:hypothetical protein